MRSALVCLYMCKSEGRWAGIGGTFQSKWQRTGNESLCIDRGADALVHSPLGVKCAEDRVAFLLCNCAPSVTAQTRHC